LSRARNTGWQAAKGEYVAYLDDDAIANPDWLQKIVEAFESIKPQPGIIGGKVEPVWEAPRPAWLADKLLGQLALVDWGDHPKFLSDEEWIAGANTAFPVTVLEKIGGFKESLGRKGKSLLSMEENLARIEIEKRGYGCYYEPAAVVKHRITAERLTQKWFIDRAYWNGVSGALFNGYIQPPSLPARICKSVSTIARIVFSPREVYCWLVPTSKPDVFAGKCSVYARFGHVAALLKAQTA
jgi:glycosyltransferase involved in cell wall biosynthesis